MQLASLDSFAPDRTFDVLLAFSVLESLTEQQIQDFLERFRRNTRQAIFAVISAPPQPATSANLPSDDNDFSHITLRPREWWDRQFHVAGWFRDEQALDFQRRCEDHPLPARMGWNVYAYLANDPSAGDAP